MKNGNLRFRTHSKPKPKKRMVVKTNTGRYIRCTAVADPLAETKLGKQKKSDQKRSRIIIYDLPRSPMLPSFTPESIDPFIDDGPRLSIGIGTMGVGAAAAFIKPEPK